MAGSDYDCLGIFERSNEMILSTKEDFENAILRGEEIKHSTVFYTDELPDSVSVPQFGDVNKAGFVYVGTFKDVQLWINKFDAPEQMTFDEAKEYAKNNKCHIPTIEQLVFTHLYKDEVNTALEAAGGEPLKEDDWYWSSSECNSDVSWLLNMNSGYRGNYYKTSNFYVRSFQLIEN